MYYIIAISLLLLLFITFRKKKGQKVLFRIVYVVISLMAILRYGQGTDYFNYKSLYDIIERCVFDEDYLLPLLLLSDFGFTSLNELVIFMGISYEVFQAMFTTVIMVFFYKFLSKRCNYSFASFLLFYCVIYMIYALSAVRQGLCMAVFYSYLYPLLVKRQIKKYVLLTLPLLSIHTSSIIFLSFPLLQKVKIREKQLLYLFGISLSLLLVGTTFLSKIPIGFIQARMEAYMGEQSSNMIFAMIIRCLLVIPLLYLPKKILKDKELYFCRMMMFFGFFIYCLTSFSELVCSRLWVYFLGFECIILSRLNYIRIMKNKRMVFICYYIFIAMTLWVKDIGATMEQGEYKHCSVFSYPYISHFDSEKYLNYYRTRR